MQKRQSHKKSRNGCSNCKLRHVKCDEQGRPCANCILRKTESTCNVIVTKANLHERYRSPASPSGLSPEPSSGNSVPGPAPSRSNPAHHTRLLELELLHRWTSETWKSFSAVPADHEYNQVVIPRDSLEHSYLLNGILCAAALDIAVQMTASGLEPKPFTSGKGVRYDRDVRIYVRAALEYYSAGLALYRAELANITPENLHQLYMFSCLVAMVNLAIPRFTESWDVEPEDDQDDHSIEGRSDTVIGGGPGANMLARMVTSFELLKVSSQMVKQHPDWLLSSPFGDAMRQMVQIMSDPLPGGLDPDTEEALSRIGRIVDVGEFDLLGGSPSTFPVSPLAASSPHSLSPLPPEPELQSTYYDAMGHLRLCFIEATRSRIWGFCTAYPGLVGSDFATAFKHSRPVALMILMHWAVLLEQCGRDENGWWAEGAGKALVDDITQVFVSKFQAVLISEDWIEGIEWTRNKVGLVEIRYGDMDIGV